MFVSTISAAYFSMVHFYNFIKHLGWAIYHMDGLVQDCSNSSV